MITRSFIQFTVNLFKLSFYKNAFSYITLGLIQQLNFANPSKIMFVTTIDNLTNLANLYSTQGIHIHVHCIRLKKNLLNFELNSCLIQQ